jgi:hypothetical protein
MSVTPSTARFSRAGTELSAHVNTDCDFAIRAGGDGFSHRIVDLFHDKVARRLEVRKFQLNGRCGRYAHGEHGCNSQTRFLENHRNSSSGCVLLIGFDWCCFT